MLQIRQLCDHLGCGTAGISAFANPKVYEFLETERMGYAIRLPANRVLQNKIGYLLRRPAHEVRRHHASFSYQAQSWGSHRVWSRRSSGTAASFIPASASSSPTWRGRQSASSPPTTSAAQRSNGSKKARERSKWTRLSCRSFARQRCPSSAPRAGLQPWQFHADARDAVDGGTAVADPPAREADQDRRQGREPRRLRHLPAGRGRGVAAHIRGYPDAHRPAVGATRAGVTGRWEGQMRQTTTGEVRLDERKATGCGLELPDCLAANGVAAVVFRCAPP